MKECQTSVTSQTSSKQGQRMGEHPMNSRDMKVVQGILRVSAMALPLGSVNAMTITSTVAAPGVLGWLGMTTTATTVVALPVAGVLAVGGLTCFGAMKAMELRKKSR